MGGMTGAMGAWEPLWILLALGLGIIGIIGSILIARGLHASNCQYLWIKIVRRLRAGPSRWVVRRVCR